MRLTLFNGFYASFKEGTIWTVCEPCHILEHLTAPAETPLSAMEMGNGAAAQIAPAAVVSGGEKKRNGSMGHGASTERTPRKGITLNIVMSGRQPFALPALPST